MHRVRNGCRLLVAAGAMAALAGVAHAEETPGRVITKLTDGVYSIEHSDPRRGAASGNSTVIIGDRQVMVVDSCFLPSDARKDIEHIRQWTDKPVAFVLNTHFHNDHNFGNRVYMDAFPAVTIIAQVETKRDMDLIGHNSAERYDRGTPRLLRMLDTGKTPDGQQLDAEDAGSQKRACPTQCRVGRYARHPVSKCDAHV